MLRFGEKVAGSLRESNRYLTLGQDVRDVERTGKRRPTPYG